MIGAERLDLILKFGIGFVLIVALSAIVIKAFARPLGFRRAFLIALAGCAAFAIPSAVAGVLEAMLRLPDGATTLNSIVGTFSLVAPTMVINWLAGDSGLPKTGWIGLGGKTVLTTYGLCLVLVFVAGAFGA